MKPPREATSEETMKMQELHRSIADLIKQSPNPEIILPVLEHLTAEVITAWYQDEVQNDVLRAFYHRLRITAKSIDEHLKQLARNKA